MSKEYIRKEVAALLGIRPATIEHYVREGIVTLKENPGGKGTRNKFSVRNILEIAIAKRLTKMGISISVARAVINNLKYLHLAVDGKEELTAEEKEKIKDLILQFTDRDAWDENTKVWIEIAYSGTEKDLQTTTDLHFLSKGQNSIKAFTPGTARATFLVNVTDLKMKVLQGLD